MHNELFSIGGLTVYTYGLMIAIGIIAAYYVADKRGKKMGLDTSHLDSLAFWAVVSGFLGSKLLYWLTRLPDIFTDPSILLNLGDGWVVYGGIIGGIFGGWLYCHIKGMNFWTWFDLIIPEVALAQGFGRIGCFFAGCCYGVEVSSGFGLVFPADSIAPGGVPLFPTQLISSAFDFLLFFVLIRIARKQTFQGEIAVVYLLCYSIGRFIIEFFRGDLIRGVYNSLSTSQIISICMALAAIGLWIWLKKHKPLSQKRPA